MNSIYTPDLPWTASDVAESEELRGQVIALIMAEARATVVTDDIHALRRAAHRLGLANDATSDEPPWVTVAEVLHTRLHEIIAEDEA